jgi:hypothetical protein
MSKRVELLPQSTAATLGTNRLPAKERQTHGIGHQLTNGIVVTREVIRQMGVQTLQASPGSPNPATGLGTLAADRRGLPAASVGVVRRGEGLGIYQGLKSMHTPLTLETTHGLVKFGINQPVQRGHRRSVA